MDFEYSELSRTVQECLQNFMRVHVLPAYPEWHRIAANREFPLALLDRLKARAKEEALWNLFLPSLREDQPGTRLSNLDYAPLAEIMGRIPWCPEVFNCNAPDTGNMELLQLFASADQGERWLKPLMEGDIRSCFAMTEPDVASSDATNLRTSIRRDGDDLIVNGRKWFITGAAHPRCRFAIVMGLSESRAGAAAHERHSLVIVPMDTPGVEIVRDLAIMNHHAPDGHCEMLFRDVRVPASNLLGEEGQGFALAQARLGPGRVHHCMRTIGMCELALDLMCERTLERKAFGRYLNDYANVQEWIAQSRIEIDQARLLVLHAAWTMDKYGNAAARTAVSAIKVVAAQLQTRVVDRAMQVFGGMGLTPDTPLPWLWAWGRAMRFLDGPDEVHLRAVAKTEIARAKENLGSTAVYYNLPVKQ
ncbi:MAG: acyl-CoA dehydrogenase family protein [Burkholderiales bacterium]